LITDLKKDKTIIFSSHILQEVESICDKVVILDKGKIVADDGLTDLSNNLMRTIQLDVEFLNDISLNILEKLGPQISITQVDSRKFVVSYQNDTDIRESIFDLAVANGNKLLGISARQGNLENVFKTVTKDKTS